MEALVDNDVVVKVARYSMTAEFDRVLRAKGAQKPYRSLPMARFTLKIDEKHLSRKFANEAARSDAKAFLTGCKPLGDPVDTKRVALLSSIPNIDPGEAVLFDYACANPDSMIFTGDKRCIVALAASQSAQEIVKLLQKRIVQFDSIVEAMCLTFGWKSVRERVCADADADAGLAKALDPSHHETTAKANLSSRISALFGDSAGLINLDF